MSWSLDVVGRAPAVIAVVQKQNSAYKCVEPEESIRQALGAVIEKALDAFPSDVAVTVKGNGSQGMANADGKVSNYLTVTIQPLYGFVE